MCKPRHIVTSFNEVGMRGHSRNTSHSKERVSGTFLDFKKYYLMPFEVKKVMLESKIRKVLKRHSLTYGFYNSSLKSSKNSHF